MDGHCGGLRCGAQVGGEEIGKKREEIYWPQIPKAVRFGHRTALGIVSLILN